MYMNIIYNLLVIIDMSQYENAQFINCILYESSIYIKPFDVVLVLIFENITLSK